jgi:hypothetical protein
LVGGSLAIAPRTGQGTRVTCRVPSVEAEEFAIV